MYMVFFHIFLIAFIKKKTYMSNATRKATFGGFKINRNYYKLRTGMLDFSYNRSHDAFIVLVRVHGELERPWLDHAYT